jgi:8-oxo-dGTP pyrophosphatase MutT (NUDIX family)
MDGKSHSQSAAQEALEEAGVEGKVSDTPIGSYHYTKLLKDRSSLHAQGLIFPLRVDRLRNRWAEDDQRRRRWFRQEQAARSVFEPDLARFLAGLELAHLQLF